MGSQTNHQIATWRARAGLESPPPAACGLWCELQDAAYDAIKVAELEKSGIRDGDGFWHGGDVIGHVLSDLHRIVCALMLANSMPDPRQSRPEDCSIKSWDETPF